MIDWKSLIHCAADLLFDCRCAACNERFDGGGAPVTRVFCPLCAHAVLPLDGHKCVRCAELFEGASRDHTCGVCLSDPPAFEAVCSPLQYGGPVADAIARFKYGRNSSLASSLGSLMCMGPFPQVDVVVPVPLHKKRLVERGFNQASLLGRVAARTARVPMAALALRRIATPPQVGKGRKERIREMDGVFHMANSARLSGKRVLLVDDVVTTTATVRAAAKVLRKQGGASSVAVLCLARAT